MTLTDGTSSAILPDDLLWSDEWEWTPLVQSAEYSLTGALIVENATRLAGRPVTLAADKPDLWVYRETLDSLNGLDPTTDWTLTGLVAEPMTVVPRDDWLVASPVAHWMPTTDSQPYNLTLRLMQI